MEKYSSPENQTHYSKIFFYNDMFSAEVLKNIIQLYDGIEVLQERNKGMTKSVERYWPPSCATDTGRRFSQTYHICTTYKLIFSKKNCLRKIWRKNRAVKFLFLRRHMDVCSIACPFEIYSFLLYSQRCLILIKHLLFARLSTCSISNPGNSLQGSIPI